MYVRIKLFIDSDCQCMGGTPVTVTSVEHEHP